MSVHDSIDSLIGGVSQQAPSLRFKSQAEVIENCWLSPTQGLVPRSHTAHRAKVFDGKGGPFYPHGIDRDRLERYVVLLRQQELLAHDLRGDAFPFRWDARQLLTTPTDPRAGDWTVVNGTMTIALEPGGDVIDPNGNADDGIFEVTIDASTSGQSFKQAITKITGPAVTPKRDLVDDRHYIVWGYAKPPAGSLLEKTRLNIQGQSGVNVTTIEIDWTHLLGFETSLFTPNGTGKHDHGVIRRGDGWFIIWAVVTWDESQDLNGIQMQITPELNSVASSRKIQFWRLMVEEWDPTLEGPSLDWTDEIDASAIDLSTRGDYFDLRQTNPTADPETFGAGWTRGTKAAAPVVSAFANPFAFAAGNRFYQKLAHTGGGLITDGAYFQTIGTIFPGPQVWFCYFRKEDSSANVKIRLNIRDTVGAQSTNQDFTWSGTDLVLSGSASGAVLAAGVVQSPFDDEDWMAYIVAHPDKHASVTAGNARDCYVYIFEDAVAAVHTYAFGAAIIDGERAAKFLDYINPIRNAQMLTVQDSTFVVNPDRKTEKTIQHTPEDATGERAYFFVKQGGFNNEYIIRLIFTDGTKTEVFCTTWDNTAQAAKCIFSFGTNQTTCEANGGTWQVAADDLESAETTEIAAKLASDLNAVSGITAQAVGSVIEVFIDGAKTIRRVETEDSEGDTALIAIWRNVKKVQDLPKDMRDGWRIAIRGGAEAVNEQAYYLQFLIDGESGEFGTGDWFESAYWDARDTLEPKSLPHRILRKQDDSVGTLTGTANQIYFEVSQIPWHPRLVGDNDSNPFPPMISTDRVDAFVTDVFFVQGRLGFLSGESVILSEVGRLDHIFRSTVIDVIDSDAIAGSASHTRASILRHAIVLDERLIVGSDDTEFVIEGEPLLSPKTFQAIPTADQETLRRASWVKSRRGFFTGFPKRADSDDSFAFSGVSEIRSASGNSGPQLFADDVTSAVPAYLEGEIEHLASRPSLGLLLVVTDGGRCFPFKYFSSGAEDLQQAWSEWIFGGDRIRFAFFAQTEAVFLIKREEGLFLETMRIGENLLDDGSTILTRLDRRVDETDVTLVYDAVDDETTVTLPYDVRTGATMLCIDKVSLVQYKVKSATALAPTLVVAGDRTSDELWFGETYLAKYVFTKPFLRTQDASQTVQRLNAGEVTVLQGILSYADTAAFDVEIAHRHADTFLEQFSAFDLGTPDADLDAVVLKSDDFQFSVGGEPQEVTITVTSRAHLPFQLLKALWIGNYAARSSPVRA